MRGPWRGCARRHFTLRRLPKDTRPSFSKNPLDTLPPKIYHFLHCDITGNIMDACKLDKIKREIRELRRQRVVTYSDLVAIAASLKRVKLAKAQTRGKEPAFVSTVFSNARPISIPFHGKNKGMATGTVKNILNDLEDDVFRFEEIIRKEAGEDYIDESSGYPN